MKQYYPSKKDCWCGLLFFGVLSPLSLYVLIMENNLMVRCIFISLLLFIFCLWFDTGYTIKDHHLYIKSGPIRGKVDILKIKKVIPAKNILSSAALSIDRLYISSSASFWNSGWYISPKDQLEFIKELKKINPHIGD